MNLIESKGDSFVFQLGKREKHLLCRVLQLYPLLNSTYHRLSKTADEKEIEPDQKLLEAALDDHRREHKQQLETMLNDAQQFQSVEDGYRLALSSPQMEWLLQALNDIRVGSWLILGCPDEKKGKLATITAENAIYAGALELCGHFQMALLEAFDQPAPNP